MTRIDLGKFSKKLVDQIIRFLILVNRFKLKYILNYTNLALLINWNISCARLCGVVYPCKVPEDIFVIS
jgi:hypothetical protein